MPVSTKVPNTLIEYCYYRFLKRLWNFASENQQLIANENITQAQSAITTESWQQATPQQQETRHQIHVILKQANYDIEKLQLNTIVSACMKMLNILHEVSIENTITQQLIHEGNHDHIYK